MTSIIMLSYVVDMHFPLLVINVCNLHIVSKKVSIKMTTGIRHDIIQTVHDCIGVQCHADCTIYAFKCEICRHRFGTPLATSLAPLRQPFWHPCGTWFVTPVEPGLAPLWHLVRHPYGTRSVTQVAPVSHLQLWVPNLVPVKGAIWAPYFLGAKWRLMGCRFLDKGSAP